MDWSQSRRTQRISIVLPKNINQRLCEQCLREGISLAELATALLERAVLEQSLREEHQDDAEDA